MTPIPIEFSMSDRRSVIGGRPHSTLHGSTPVPTGHEYCQRPYTRAADQYCRETVGSIYVDRIGTKWCSICAVEWDDLELNRNGVQPGWRCGMSTTCTADQTGIIGTMDNGWLQSHIGIITPRQSNKLYKVLQPAGNVHKITHRTNGPP